MQTNRIEIKITEDKSSQKVNVEAMTLPVAKALLKLFESLTNIAELTPNNEDLRIQVTKGSAVVAVEGERVSHALKEFENIISNKCTNKELVEQWRNIQGVFMANGLTYEANFYEKGKVIPFYDTLRKHQRLRTKSVALKKFDAKIEFVKGKLIAVGGKKPNIHVEVDGKAMQPVACTEWNATKAKAYLYKTIFFSTWDKKVGDQNRCTLCDSYADEDIYVELSSLVKKLNSMEQIAALKLLHHQCRSYLDEQQYPKLRKLIRLFAHEDTDINILKTILIVTQALREHEKLNDSIRSLQVIFEKKLAEYHKYK